MPTLEQKYRKFLDQALASDLGICIRLADPEGATTLLRRMSHLKSMLRPTYDSLVIGSSPDSNCELWITKE
jgi:hypothetical protein